MSLLPLNFDRSMTLPRNSLGVNENSVVVPDVGMGGPSIGLSGSLLPNTVIFSENMIGKKSSAQHGTSK